MNNFETGSNPPDVVDSRVKSWDDATRRSTGMSLMHMLTLGSIGASIALYLAGKKELGIFIGLWPPTFQALRSSAEKH